MPKKGISSFRITEMKCGSEILKSKNWNKLLSRI
jgi:hypothetical protein